MGAGLFSNLKHHKHLAGALCNNPTIGYTCIYAGT